MVRRTNKKIIESESLDAEHSYVQAPLKELIPTTKSSDASEVESDEDFEHEFYRERGMKRHRDVHTHTYSGMPSLSDLRWAVRRRDIAKESDIAQRNPETGELEGYTCLYDKIGKQTPKQLQEYRINAKKAVDDFKERYILELMDEEEMNREMLKLVRGQGFDIRFHPEEGYYFNKERGRYEKREHNIERTVASILIGFTLLFLLFKVPFTGFVVSDSSTNEGAGLFFVLGLLLTTIVYFALKKNKKID